MQKSISAECLIWEADGVDVRIQHERFAREEHGIVIVNILNVEGWMDGDVFDHAVLMRKLLGKPLDVPVTAADHIRRRSRSRTARRSLVSCSITAISREPPLSYCSRCDLLVDVGVTAKYRVHHI